MLSGFWSDLEATIGDLDTKLKEAVKESFSSFKDELKGKIVLKFKDIEHHVGNLEQFSGTAMDQEQLKDLLVAEVTTVKKILTMSSKTKLEL